MCFVVRFGTHRYGSNEAVIPSLGLRTYWGEARLAQSYAGSESDWGYLQIVTVFHILKAYFSLQFQSQMLHIPQNGLLQRSRNLRASARTPQPHVHQSLLGVFVEAKSDDFCAELVPHQTKQQILPDSVQSLSLSTLAALLETQLQSATVFPVLPHRSAVQLEEHDLAVDLALAGQFEGLVVAEEGREGVDGGEWDEVELVVLILAVPAPPPRIQAPGF